MNDFELLVCDRCGKPYRQYQTETIDDGVGEIEISCFTVGLFGTKMTAKTKFRSYKICPTCGKTLLYWMGRKGQHDESRLPHT